MDLYLFSLRDFKILRREFVQEYIKKDGKVLQSNAELIAGKDAKEFPKLVNLMSVEGKKVDLAQLATENGGYLLLSLVFLNSGHVYSVEWMKLLQNEMSEFLPSCFNLCVYDGWAHRFVAYFLARSLASSLRACWKQLGFVVDEAGPLLSPKHLLYQRDGFDWIDFEDCEIANNHANYFMLIDTKGRIRWITAGAPNEVEKRNLRTLITSIAHEPKS